MKIIFFNVWNGHIKDGLGAFLKQQTSDTDIFCFQEATDGMIEDTKALFTDYTRLSDYKFITKDDDFPQTIYVKNGIDVVSSGTLFQDEQDKGLGLYVEVKSGDKTMYICNVHGYARPNNKLDSPARIEVSERLVEFFKDEEAPIIVGGDFNIELGTRSLEIFTESGYKNLVAENNIQTTRNRLAWEKYPGNELYHSNHIFVNDQVAVTDFEVIDNEISDHLPILLTIDF